MPISIPIPPGTIILAMTFATFGCQTGPDPDRNAAPDPQATAPDVSPVTVLDLSLGDRACYMTVDDGSGMKREELAEFELCSRDDLVGRRVQLNTRMARVQAASCAGDPDCTQSDTVAIVTSVRIVE